MRFTFSSLWLADLFLHPAETNNKEGASEVTGLHPGWAGPGTILKSSSLGFPWRQVTVVRKSFFRSNESSTIHYSLYLSCTSTERVTTGDAFLSAQVQVPHSKSCS